MKNSFFALSAVLLSGLLLPTGVHAQTAFDFADIDTLMEDNSLTDTANRYAAVMLSFFPERATRLGFASANSKLNNRSAANNALALNALRSVQEAVDGINASQLSASNRADLTLLQDALHADMWELEQNRIANDPLYYTQAFDAIYDVMLKKTSSSVQQRQDVNARINALPEVAQQDEKNLVQPPAYLSQQAMERAYYAYLSFDEITEFLLQDVEDDVSIAQIKKDCQNAKRAVKQMFDLFKRLSQEKDSQDFRLGEEKYARILQDRYQIDQKPAKVEKRLEKEFKAAQKSLSAALEPFVLETADEEVTVVDDLNNNPTVEPLPEKKAKKTKKGKFVPPSAQDFYKAAHRVAAGPASSDLLAGLSQDAKELANFFAQDGTLPPSAMRFSVKAMPGFYAYTQAYLFVPPFGNQLAPSTDLFLRLPAGNRLAKQEQLKKDFNAPTRKMLLCGELVPGRYYQTVAGKNLSSIRRLYPSASLANGWSAYALRLARERGYLVTDEELLFLAWNEYRRAAAALVDVRLQTKQYSYTDAINFLVSENGFSQEEAEQIVKEVSAQPAEAVSYCFGLDAIEKARAKYAKKFGKKFNLADFHAKLLQAGNVPPAQLEQELERLYDAEKQRAKQAESF